MCHPEHSEHLGMVEQAKNIPGVSKIAYPMASMLSNTSEKRLPPLTHISSSCQVKSSQACR